MMTAVFDIAEDMRVPAFHLVANPADNVFKRELAGFLGHLRMEDDLELEIAEFVRERLHVLAGNRVGDFVRFFDGVRRNALERLHGVPFAAADRIAEAPHDLPQTLKRHYGPRTRPWGSVGLRALEV